MNVYLKIKIKVGVVESRIIRHEEQKRLGFLRHCRIEARAGAMLAQAQTRAGGTHSVLEKPEQVLGFVQAERNRSYVHTLRTVGLRQETRAMLLAYGFLRGRAYRRMENVTHTRPKWGLVLDYILRYAEHGDDRSLRQTFSEWLADSGLPNNMMPSVSADLTKGG